MDDGDKVIITGLTPQKKAGRLNLFVDGAFYSGVSELTAATHKLTRGRELTGAELSAALLESDASAAFDYALKLLSFSARGEAELIRRLKEKTYAPEAIDAAVEKLKGYGYISDSAFARSFAESQKARSGSRKIRAGLLKKGIGDETVRDTLEALGGQEEEAKALAQRFMRSKEYTRETYAKLLRHLMQKGFPYAEAAGAAKSVYADFNTEAPEDYCE